MVEAPFAHPHVDADRAESNGVRLRGTSLDSQNACAWDVSTSQLTLAVRRVGVAASIGYPWG